MDDSTQGTLSDDEIRTILPGDGTPEAALNDDTDDTDGTDGDATDGTDGDSSATA